MQILAKSIDDLKTERKGVSPPLPPLFRLLPMLFYLTIAAAVGLNGIFFLRLSQEVQRKEASIKRKSDYDAALKNAQTERRDLEGEAKKASDIVSWVDTTRPLQPLVVEIARSIAPDSTLVELRLERDEDSPNQIKVSMRLNSDSTRQLDNTLEKISSQRYRTYSPQQTVNGQEIDYKATLLWQDPSRPQSEPATPTK